MRTRNEISLPKHLQGSNYDGEGSRERHKTIDLMMEKIASARMFYLCSFPAKQHRQMLTLPRFSTANENDHVYVSGRLGPRTRPAFMAGNTNNLADLRRGRRRSL